MGELTVIDWRAATAALWARKLGDRDGGWSSGRAQCRDPGGPLHCIIGVTHSFMALEQILAPSAAG